MKRWRKVLAAAGILLALLLVVAVWNWRALLRAYFVHHVTSVTTALPSCDRVEVFHLGELRRHGVQPNVDPGFPIRPYENGEASILGQITLHGADAEALASLWRSQKFDWKYQALCHEPAYGFRYYSGRTLLFETSVCFHCSNFYVAPLGLPDWWGFDAHGPKAQEFLQRLQQLFPDSIPKPK